MDDREPLIVVVNDDAGTRYLLTRILRSAGWRVEEAATGLEGLRLVRDLSPEVVVLDVKLPDLLGHEVCRRIKSDPETSGVSVIQTSATFVTSEGKARGLDSGADAYLAQPFESVELIAMVKSLFRLRKSESQARQRAEALGVADRRKDEFLAMLAHELRNPLSAILAGANLLERGDISAEELRKLGATIGHQTRHLAKLVDDLLDVARVNSGKIQVSPAPVDLGALVAGLVELHRPSTEARGLDLVCELPDRAVWIEADATRIDQVVTNLITNAIKYTEAGGAITVRLEAHDSKTTLHVCDTGVGISDENLPVVWDLFYQVDGSLARSQSGLGIGLTMVKRIIELHRGRVGVSSKGLGKGAEFSIELPTIEAPQETEAPPKEDPSSRPKLDILLVDDNEDSCEMYEIALGRAGHTTHSAHNGQDGLELALTRAFDVAIVDIGLPVMDGYEVARRMRVSLGDRCPYLIALTGYGRPEDRARALGAGFDEHLVKPVDLRQVERILREARANRAA
jgi:two-component system, sensor histidine kinase